MSAVVVRAKFGYENRDMRDRWEVQKGDLGVLGWFPHKRYSRFLEARVTWDRDPKRKARRIILSSITIVGLQTPSLRVLLSAIPTQFE